MGYLLKVLAIVIGAVVLSAAKVCSIIHQMVCRHPSLEPGTDGDYVYCLKCGKEIWTPWTTSMD